MSVFPLEGYHRVPRPMQCGPAPRSLEILFLYGRLPLPMTRGDELTVSHLLEFLFARGHKVDFLTLNPPGQTLRPEHKAWIESRCRRAVFIPHKTPRALFETAQGWLKGWPAQIGYFRNHEQVAQVERWIAEHDYDLAYAYYLRSAEALRPAAKAVPVSFLALQLSQTLNTERLGQNAKSAPERWFYRAESARLGRYEANIWQMASRCVLIGNKDVEAIRTVCRQHGQPEIDNVVFGPHGVDTAQFAPRAHLTIDPDMIVMSGVMRYAPNVGAALWFIKEVWPRIRAERPQARFCLVGRDPEQALREMDGKSGIEVTGTVEDPGDWIGKAAVCVAPIQAAAGLQNKLLEAMAMARPIVATSVANEGIGGTPGRDLVIADAPDVMASEILDLLANPARGAEIGSSARAFIEQHWTWEGPFLKLEEAFFAAQDTAKTGKEELPARAQAFRAANAPGNWPAAEGTLREDRSR